MERYVATIYDYKNHQAEGFINVMELNFRHERVLIKCKNSKGEIFVINISPEEFQEIRIERK